MQIQQKISSSDTDIILKEVSVLRSKAQQMEEKLTNKIIHKLLYENELYKEERTTLTNKINELMVENDNYKKDMEERSCIDSMWYKEARHMQERYSANSKTIKLLEQKLVEKKTLCDYVVGILKKTMEL